MGDTSATARTKHSPHGPVKAPSGSDFLMVPNGRLCEDAMDPGGADQADMMRPDAKHIPEDLKAKMPVRINTQGV